MKETIMALSFLCAISIHVQGQHYSKSNTSSIELSFGANKVGFHQEEEFMVLESLIFENITRVIPIPGYEVHGKLSWFRDLGTKNQLILGLNFNQWKYPVVEVIGWNRESIETNWKSRNLFGGSIGHRFIFLRFEENHLFWENTFSGEYNASEDFEKYRIRWNTGLGISTAISQKIRLNTKANFQQVLNNISLNENVNLRPYGFGIELGVAVDFN